MEPFQVFDVAHELVASNQLWKEMLRTDEMSVGVYRLNAGSSDPQQPHQQQEVYYCVEGRATLLVEDRPIPFQTGSVAFVDAQQDHRFVDIVEDIVLLVFFAPPESTES